MNKSNIQWCDMVWNPVTGCTPISEGCAHCYAKTMAETRLRGRCGYPEDEPFRVTFHEDRLLEPSQVKKTQNVFVCSMGDLFHEDVTDDQLGRVFFEIEKAYMETQYCHNFLVLTKRSSRLKEYIWKIVDLESDPHVGVFWRFPNNLWIGVTAENQQIADERIPDLIATGHNNLFVSLEPLLGPVDLSPYLGKLKWVIIGAESGPNKRICDVDWVHDIIGDCDQAGVPVFYKQGPDDYDKWCKEPYVIGQQWLQFPEELKLEKAAIANFERIEAQND